MTWREGKQCASCQFFDRTLSAANKKGGCRKQPPTSYNYSPSGMSADWPTVGDEDWCGAWEGEM